MNDKDTGARSGGREQGSADKAGTEESAADLATKLSLMKGDKFDEILGKLYDKLPQGSPQKKRLERLGMDSKERGQSRSEGSTQATMQEERSRKMAARATEATGTGIRLEEAGNSEGSEMARRKEKDFRDGNQRLQTMQLIKATILG